MIKITKKKIIFYKKVSMNNNYNYNRIKFEMLYKSIRKKLICAMGVHLAAS